MCAILSQRSSSTRAARQHLTSLGTASAGSSICASCLAVSVLVGSLVACEASGTTSSNGGPDGSAGASSDASTASGGISAGGSAGSGAAATGGGASGSGGTSGTGNAGGSGDTDGSVGGSGGSSGATSCPGYTPPSGYSTCRTQQDCANGDLCSPTPLSQSYASCVGCSIGCQSDADCQPGEVCYSTPCFCPANPSLTTFSGCIPRCTSTSCAADETCGADGLCAPTPCTSGYTCPEGQVCKPDSLAAHACEYASCVTDGYACPTGYLCGTGGGSDDVHGCVAIPCGASAPPCPENTECTGTGDARGCSPLQCMTDADCDCGVCINSECANGLWVCSPPPPQ